MGVRPALHYVSLATKDAHLERYADERGNVQKLCTMTYRLVICLVAKNYAPIMHDKERKATKQDQRCSILNAEARQVPWQRAEQSHERWTEAPVEHFEVACCCELCHASADHRIKYPHYVCLTKG